MIANEAKCKTDLLKILSKEETDGSKYMFEALATIQATSMETKRVFSVCGQFVAKIKNRLSGKNVSTARYERPLHRRKSKLNRYGL